LGDSWTIGLLIFVAMSTAAGVPAADLRKKLTRHADFPTAPIHAPVCIGDAVVCTLIFRKCVSDEILIFAAMNTTDLFLSAETSASDSATAGL